jgi:putative transposase
MARDAFGRRVPAGWNSAPQAAAGSYSPASQATSKAKKRLTAVIQKPYIQGISTRSVDDLVKALGMGGISKSQVSPL